MIFTTEHAKFAELFLHHFPPAIYDVFPLVYFILNSDYCCLHFRQFSSF
jgi:hypothetical protein